MTFAKAWQDLPWVPDTREIWEWADGNFRMPAVMSRREFRIEQSRQFYAPLQSLKSELVREVYILAPPRSGKTMIADLFVPWSIVNDPGAVLWVFSTEPQAELHCEARLMPVLNGCPGIAPLMPNDRHKARNSQIQFSNGYPLHVFGSSLSNLQARGYKTVILDECWQFNAGRVGHARARMGDAEKTESNKFLAISQGGFPDTEWHTLWVNGTIHEWHVPCAGCGQQMLLAFAGRNEEGERTNVIWDEIKLPDGQWDALAASRTARFRCQHCGHDHPDTATTRAQWNDGGEYRVTKDGDPRKVGYRWEALTDVSMGTLVDEWLRARNMARAGVYEPTIDFIQKRRADFASQTTIMQGHQTIATAEVTAGSDWEDEVVRFMAVDLQDLDYYWVMVRAWAANGESRRLYWGHVNGKAELERIRQEYKVPAGARGTGVLIDSNWQRESRVIYSIAAEFGYMAVAGTPQKSWGNPVMVQGRKIAVQRPWSPPFKADPDSGTKAAQSRYCNCIRFSSDAISDRLQGMIDVGQWKEPKEDTKEGQEYALQLHSEVKRKKTAQDGSASYYWHQTRPDNHARDCAKMQTLAAMIRGIPDAKAMAASQ